MMKKLELIFVLLSLVSILLNLFLIPMANLFMLLSLSFLSLFYMYFSFAFFNGVQLRNIFKKVAYSDVSALRIVGAIGTGVALSQTIIGLIFKFNEWPGAFVMMSVGLSGLLVVAIVGFIQFTKNKIDYYRNIFKRIALFGGLTLILVVLPSNLMFEFKYRNYPTYIAAYKKFIDNPTNKELSDEVAAERRKVFNR
jgi:hypothetical protein